MVLKFSSLTRSIRHLRRYRYIFTVFARHGFGFILSQLPSEPEWLRDLRPFPTHEPSTLPAHFRMALEEIGPTFVKLGQMLSTRPDLLPPAYIAELAKLQDEVPPVPWPEIRRVLIAELEDAPELLFRSIDPVPIAAASLGQVHGAILPNGERVVVKIQRPHILPDIETDLEILQDLARYAEQHTPLGKLYNLVEIAEDFADTLHNELNYRLEGRNAERFAINFARERSVYIPEVYWDYTTQRVLVMERIEGVKIDDIPALEAAGYDCKRLAAKAAHLVIKQVLEDGYFHADPHPGNLVVMEGEVIGGMDFGMVGYLTTEDRLNLLRLYTVAVRMDARGVVDELIRLGAAPPTVNRRALIRDVERLLRYYHGMQLREIQINKLVNDILPLAFKYHIRFPANLWLLARSLAIMEGIGLRLDPDFDIFAFSAPYVTKLLVKASLPSRQWIEELLRRALAWDELLNEVPRTGMLLLNRIQRDAPIKLTIAQSCLIQLDRLVTRLALSIIVAGMTISLGLILPSTAESGWIVQGIVALGFAISFFLGIWLAYSILRGGRA